MGTHSLPKDARTAPAAQRNAAPILAILQQYLPDTARICEIASGSGEHARYFTDHMPGWHWQPSDMSADARMSIAAWAKNAAHSRIAAPLALDTLDLDWSQHPSLVQQGSVNERAGPNADAALVAQPTEPFNALFCANMIHISAPEATPGLISGAAQLLSPLANQAMHFVLYGPFMVGGRHTAPSNASFDNSLKSRDPSWGLKDLGEVVDMARQHGLVHLKTHAMPANNLCVVFRRMNGAPTPV